MSGDYQKKMKELFGLKPAKRSSTLCFETCAAWLLRSTHSALSLNKQHTHAARYSPCGGGTHHSWQDHTFWWTNEHGERVITHDPYGISDDDWANITGFAARWGLDVERKPGVWMEGRTELVMFKARRGPGWAPEDKNEPGREKALCNHAFTPRDLPDWVCKCGDPKRSHPKNPVCFVCLQVIEYGQPAQYLYWCKARMHRECWQKVEHLAYDRSRSARGRARTAHEFIELVREARG